MSSHNERKMLETRLDAFLSLKSTGLENDYINSNIEYHTSAYHELTGDWYRCSPTLQKTITGERK